MNEHLVHLGGGTVADPSGVLIGAWRSFAVRRIAPGERLELVADQVEHLAYVIAGTGEALVSGERMPFAPGTAFSIVRDDGVTLDAAEPVQLFVATLAV